MAMSLFRGWNSLMLYETATRSNPTVAAPMAAHQDCGSESKFRKLNSVRQSQVCYKPDEFARRQGTPFRSNPRATGYNPNLESVRGFESRIRTHALGNLFLCGPSALSTDISAPA